MVEVLRFSREFRSIDPHGEYTIEDFVDWLALSCAQDVPQHIVGKLPLRSVL
jgi:hypothetical protein